MKGRHALTGAALGSMILLMEPEKRFLLTVTLGLNKFRESLWTTGASLFARE